MLDKAAVAAFIPRLVSPDAAEREAARRALYAGDEAAAVILCDLFLAGLNEAQGGAVLEILGAIGGFDALMLLLNTFYDSPRPAYKAAAARALRHNRANLTAEEWADMAAFLAEENL